MKNDEVLMARRTIKRKPIPRSAETEEKTGWAKAKPLVLGIGIPAVIIIGLIIGVSSLFRSSYRGAEVYIETEPDLSVLEKAENNKPPQPTEHPQEVSATNPVADRNVVQSSGETVQSVSGENVARASSSQVADTQQAAVIDSEAVKAEIEKRVKEEIAKIRDFYHGKRRSLRDEAVAFLRARHSQKGVKMKAANFRKLADQLLKDIEKFGEPSSEAEGKIWEAQKEELRKSANYCRNLASQIEMTGGNERKMKITATNLENQQVP